MSIKRQTRQVITNEALASHPMPDSLLAQAFIDVRARHEDDGAPVFWETIQRTGITPWPIELEVSENFGTDCRVVRVVERTNVVSVT